MNTVKKENGVKIDTQVREQARGRLGEEVCPAKWHGKQTVSGNGRENEAMRIAKKGNGAKMDTNV